MKKKFIMNPKYISGLTQTDGSFFCSIILSKRHRFGIQFRPKFCITADLDSKHVLESIQLYFQFCGKIYINNKNHTAEYVVERIDDLHNIIIPHFINNPIYCAKLHAFELFNYLVKALYDKNKHNIEDRREMLIKALSMNMTTNRNLDRIKLLFSLLDIYFLEGIEKIEATKYKNQSNSSYHSMELSSEFISGMFDGDGSFFIIFQKDGNIKTGFNLTSDIYSRPLLEIIKQKLNGAGSINIVSKNELRLSITGLNQIINNLIPFVEDNPLFSERSSHFIHFRKVSFLLKKEYPLNLQTKLSIVDKYYNMNKEGKRRKIDQSDYVNLLLEIHK